MSTLDTLPGLLSYGDTEPQHNSKGTEMGIEIFRHRDSDGDELVVENGVDVLMFRAIVEGVANSVLVPMEKGRDLVSAVSALPGYEVATEPPTTEPDAIRVTALGLALRGWTQKPYGDVVARADAFESYLRHGAPAEETMEAGPCPEPISPQVRALFGMANAAATEQPRPCDGCGHAKHASQCRELVTLGALDNADECGCVTITAIADGGVPQVLPRRPVTDDVPKCGACGHSVHGTVKCRALTTYRNFDAPCPCTGGCAGCGHARHGGVTCGAVLDFAGACPCTGPETLVCGVCQHAEHGTVMCSGYFRNGTVACSCTGRAEDYRR